MVDIRRYIDALYDACPSLSTVIRYIIPSPLEIRKVMLKACRIQGPFSTTSRLYTRHKSFMDISIYPVKFSYDGPELDSSQPSSLYSFITKYSDFFSDPIICGYISMALRYLPYLDYSSVEQVKMDTLIKELTASQGGGTRSPHLNYDALFNPGSVYRDGTPGQARIGSSLRGAARRLQSSKYPLVPRGGKKNIPLPSCSTTSYHPYERKLGRPIKTLDDVETVYIKYGVELYGKTEMRSVWRGNDLKPRVYYSRGPSLHRPSVYIQQIFNAFVDAFEETHRLHRHSTTVIHPDTDEILSIYDYSSFTSSLSEIRRFTIYLASIFHGFEIDVLDPHLGIVKADLGEILFQFNEDCNADPDFDASDIMHVEEYVLNHNTGMLGVPGNISSCTLLHGIHLMLVVRQRVKSKTVGDDAIAAVKIGDYGYLQEAIQDLGSVAKDKMESWSWHGDDDERIDERWDYKKRQINRLENVVITGNLIDFVPINLIGITNPFHRSFPTTPFRQQKKLISSLRKFYDDLASFPSEISELAQEVVYASMLPIYKDRKWMFGGGVDHLTGWAYAGICKRGIPFSTWIEHFSPWIRVTLPVVYEGLKQIPDSSAIGQVFYRVSDPVIAYMVRTGFLEDQTEYTEVVGRDLVDRFGALNSRLTSKIVTRKYVISCELYTWMLDHIIPSPSEDDA